MATLALGVEAGFRRAHRNPAGSAAPSATSVVNESKDETRAVLNRRAPSIVQKKREGVMANGEEADTEASLVRLHPQTDGRS
jgi:hypothetical protein